MMKKTMEKRQQSRMKLKGYIADIGDGHFVYGGMVEDVSADGLRLNDLPDKFSLEGRMYSIVISGGPNAPCYKLKVAPRWRKKNGLLVDVGFTIAEASEGWMRFVQNILPGLHGSPTTEESGRKERSTCFCCG
jgi:hypothetical protein